MLNSSNKAWLISMCLATRVISAFFSALIVIAVSSCASREPQNRTEDDHVASVEAFQLQMRRLQVLVHEREATASSVRAMRSRQMAEIARAASALGNSTDSITQRLNLDENEAAELQALFVSMRREADAAIDLANAGGSLDIAMKRVNQVCTDCHSRFGIAAP